MTLLTFLVSPPAFAQPSNKADVDGLLRQLIDPIAKRRISAANALMTTPPELVVHLVPETIEPVCAERVAVGDLVGMPPTCERWNHAMYHYIRVVGALAEDSVDPRTPLGAWCLPRSQPHAGNLNASPACALVSRLRWIVHDPFAYEDLIDLSNHSPPPFELPEAVSNAVLEKTARDAYLTALRPKIDDATTLAGYPSWSAKDGTRSVHLVPICGGQAGFQERCASHLVVSEGERVRQLILMPGTTLNGKADPGTPYTNLRMTAGVHVRLSGHHAVVVTDGGSGDDPTRRYHVFDIRSEPRLHCEVDTPIVDLEKPPPVVMPTITNEGCSI